MVVVVVFRGIVVAAAAFVVAAAHGFVEGRAVFIDIECEAALASTLWTAVAGCYSFVFL